MSYLPTHIIRSQGAPPYTPNRCSDKGRNDGREKEWREGGGEEIRKEKKLRVERKGRKRERGGCRKKTGSKERRMGQRKEKRSKKK